MICSDQHAATARAGAAQGSTLLKNEGKTLPLSTSLGSLAVIGPNGKLSRSIAGYYGAARPCQGPKIGTGDGVYYTMVDAVQQYVKTATFVQGVKGVAGNDTSGIPAAVAAAKASAATVLVVGTDLGTAHEGPSPGRASPIHPFHPHPPFPRYPCHPRTLSPVPLSPPCPFPLNGNTFTFPCFRLAHRLMVADGTRIGHNVRGTTIQLWPFDELWLTVENLTLSLACTCTGHDATDLTLSPAQLALVGAVAKASPKPVVVVVMSAVPLDLTDLLADSKVGAILYVGKSITR